MAEVIPDAKKSQQTSLRQLIGKSEENILEMMINDVFSSSSGHVLGSS